MPKSIMYIFAIAALIYSVSFAFGQYLRIREHNLAVANEIRLCDNMTCTYIAANQAVFKSDIFKTFSSKDILK
jgi:hypothetical protein